MHYAYVVQFMDVNNNFTGVFKVGYTSNLSKRLKAIPYNDKIFKKVDATDIKVIYTFEMQSKEEGLLAESLLRLFYSNFVPRMDGKDDHFCGMEVLKLPNPTNFVNSILLNAESSMVNVQKNEFMKMVDIMQRNMNKTLKKVEKLKRQVTKI